MAEWNSMSLSAKWCMMQYGKCNTGYSYNTDKRPLKEGECEMDLGVIFCQDLKSSVHCKEAYSKANRIMLGLTSMTINYRNPKSLINLYKSLVRPHLEWVYCSTVEPSLQERQVSVLRVWSHISRVCRMKKYLISWSEGPCKNVASEQTWSRSSKWLKVFYFNLLHNLLPHSRRQDNDKR